MINTSVCSEPKQSSPIIDDHFISIMTALFIEGMALDRLNERNTSSLMHPSQLWESDADASPLTLTYTKETEAIALKEYGTRKAEPRNIQRSSRKADAHKSIRTFILGLSDAFNNLFMGIWGNLSLINLTIDKGNPVFQRAIEMEQLIQNGAAMINGIFGYLGERRIVAKKIRLNRLLQEIRESMPIDDSRVKKEIIRASRISPSGSNYASAIAASLSRMLSHFMERVQQQYRLISDNKPLDSALQVRLATIERLINRGWHIITLLESYAGTYKFKIEKVSIKPLAKRLVQQFRKNHPRVNLTLDLAQKLPLIHADRSMLEYVLGQIMENAATAMPTQGNLNIDIRMVTAETPHNLCVAYRWIDSIVVTINDTGLGMDINSLLHIFDPFFSGSHNTNHLGMGLAASWGIIKAHSGYIHVRSKLGRGSVFKIYLPAGKQKIY